MAPNPHHIHPHHNSIPPTHHNFRHQTVTFYKDTKALTPPLVSLGWTFTNSVRKNGVRWVKELFNHILITINFKISTVLIQIEASLK